jgi:AcrR family transcriptional regulator
VAKSAADTTPTPRAYRSPLRERQVAQTRESILSAVAEEILEHGIHTLSMSGVAARAEVAERTVYRHFASTETLLDGLTEMVGARLGELLGDRPRLRHDREDPLDDLVEHLPGLYAAFDRIGAPARAVAVVTLARGSDAGRQRRREVLSAAFAPELAHLPQEEASALFETLYLLGGSVSWHLLTRSGELTGEQAGRAATRVVRAVLRDLRKDARLSGRAQSRT